MNTINDLVPERDDFTPYEAAGVASSIAGTYVREQMLYNYVGKGMIPSTTGVRTTKKGEREVKVITRDDLVEWLNKYFGRKAERAAKVAAQLAGESK